MHGDARRLHERALLEAHVVRQLVAIVVGQAVVLGQGAVEGRRGGKRHVGTQVVAALFAARAAAAGDAGLHGDSVARLQRLDGGADGVDDARGFVAEDYRGFDDELADAAVQPVVDLQDLGFRSSMSLG